MTCSQGSQAKLLVDVDTTFDASSERYQFLYETMKKSVRIVGARGITGTRSQSVERTRLGSYQVGGRLSMEANSGDLDKWLPRILGAAESTDSFALAESLPTFYMLFDKVGGVLRYDACYVNRAIFRSQAGPGDDEEELVEMILEIMAKDEDPDQAWPGTAPALPTTANRAPYILSDGVLTIGSAYSIKNFVLVIDNHLQPRWTNSLTATEICPADRTVMLRTTNPFTTTEFAAFYDLSTSPDGAAATLVFTNGDYSTTFTMAGLQWADNSPNVRGKTEIPLVLDFYARMKSTSRELVVTNVSA